MSHAPPPKLEGLIQLARREGVDIRPALLRVLTDLYVQGENHSREEEQQYVELALRLLPVVDVPTRTAVASKLATYPGAPTPIIAYLAGDVPQVAGPVRRHPAPSRGQRAGSALHAVATEATRVLTDGNAAGVGATPGLGERFLQAAPAERMQMLAELEARPLAEPARDAPAQDAELVRRLERAALQRNDRAFARELQLALLLPRETALRIAHDRSGEPLVVVALAIAMPVVVLQRVLLFLNPTIAGSVERVFALSRLYEQLSARAAMPIVASWRNVATRLAAARHVGAHAEQAGGGAATTGGSGDAARPVEVARSRGWPQRTS